MASRRLRSVLGTVLLAMLLGAAPAAAQEDLYNGSQLWLRYVPVSDADLRERYRRAATAIVVENAGANKVHRHTADLSMAPGSTEKLVQTSLEAARDELVRGLGGLLDQPVPVTDAIRDGAVVVGTRESSATVREHIPGADLAAVGDEGYVIRVGRGRDRDRRQDRGRRPLRHVRLPAAHADAEADRRPGHRLLAPDQEPPPQQLGGHAPVLGQQRQRHGRAQRRERDDLQLRRHRRQRRPQPAGDPRPLHRGRARDGVGRAQRHRDQPRQRQQRLPDAGLHRAGGRAGRRAAPVRHPDLAGDQLHGADRRAVRAGHADQPAARPLRRALPRLVDAQGAAAAGLDPGLHGLHRQGQLRGPAGPAGLRLRPRRRRQRHRGGGRGAGHEGLLAHVRLQRQPRQRPAQAGLHGVRLDRRRARLRRQRLPADQERPAGLPGPRALPPDVRPHGAHQPGDRAADHPGVHRPEPDADLPRADVGGGPQDRHARRRAGGGGRRRHGPGARGQRDRRRGQPRQRRQPDRPPLRPGELLRLRPPGVGLGARLGGDRAGLDADDVEQRRRRGGHDRADDDGLLGGDRELPDPARRRAPVHLQRPLRPQSRPVVHPGRLEPRLLQQGRQRRARASTAPRPAATSSPSTSRRCSSATGTSRPRRRTC